MLLPVTIFSQCSFSILLKKASDYFLGTGGARPQGALVSARCDFNISARVPDTKNPRTCRAEQQLRVQLRQFERNHYQNPLIPPVGLVYGLSAPPLRQRLLCPLCATKQLCARLWAEPGWTGPNRTGLTYCWTRKAVTRTRTGSFSLRALVRKEAEAELPPAVATGPADWYATVWRHFLLRTVACYWPVWTFQFRVLRRAQAGGEHAPRTDSSNQRGRAPMRAPVSEGMTPSCCCHLLGAGSNVLRHGCRLQLKHWPLMVFYCF